MAPNSLSPASVVFDVHSLYGAHRMTIPTLEWFPVNITGTLGSYPTWLGGTIDAQVMVTALCNKLKVFVPATWLFDSATVYTQATATSPNIPQRSVALAIAGTNAKITEQQGVSITFNFKTAANGNSKIVLLDAPLGGAWFAPSFPADFGTEVTDLETEFCAGTNAWSGRDDAQPQILRKITYDLNDKLQKEYWG